MDPADQPRLSASASGLIPPQIEPTNLETTFAALEGPLTRPGPHYVRSHFAVPVIEAGSFALLVGGRVGAGLSLTLTLDDLRVWCQTNVNLSQMAGRVPISGRAGLPPHGESGGSVGLEVLASGEAAILVEVVRD